MIEVLVAGFEAWRSQARSLLATGVGPERARFVDTRLGQSMLPMGSVEPAAKAAPVRVSKEFLALAKSVGCFRDAERWNLLYRTLWRLTHGEARLLEDHVDDDMRRLRLMEKAVHRDMHKMRAFVRFRELMTPEGPQYVAWHRPDHWIVAANAPFFVRRFGAMRWAILTPDESAYWDLKELRFGPGVPRSAAPSEDQLEDLWLAYYSSIFNPARVNLKAMRAEMPVKHWSTLPEASVIGGLLGNAGARVITMVNNQPESAKPFIPEHATLRVLESAAHKCQGCDLYLEATQTVFGEGPPGARIVMVGEQPGDQEDLAGKPFVGPAGKLLDRAMADAGLDRKLVYVTNAVKHFRFEERGKRRIHKKPSGTQISACRPWLEAELGVLQPEAIVCLGATAAQSLVGRDVRILTDRGKWMQNRWAPKLLVTVHPSALLRAEDATRREEQYALFVRDLAMVAKIL